MPLPNVIIIGVQKAGTTSLYNWISQHPDVYGDFAMKDFPFFANDEYYKRGIDWFRHCFKKHKKEKIVLHGYVNYMYFSRISAERIYDFNKDIKLILILRNPIERAYSAYWQQIKMGNEKIKNFEEALRLEHIRREGTFKDRADLTYIEHGFYHRQLNEYLKWFSREQIMIILFEDMISNKEAVVEKVYEFLGVDGTFIPSLAINNKPGVPRFEIIQRLLTYPLLPLGLKEIVPLNYRIKIRIFLKELNIKRQKYPPMKEKTKEFLINIYKNEIEKLPDLIERDVTHWMQLK